MTAIGRLAIATRLVLPLLVAGALFVQNLFPSPMVLLLALLLLGAIAMFLDQSTRPLATRGWFHAETFVRLALICSAIVNCRDEHAGYVLCVMSLLILQCLALVSQGTDKSTVRFPFAHVLGSLMVVELAWIALGAVAKNEPQLELSVPAAPLWLVGAGIFLTLLHAREFLWTTLSGTRQLSDGQKALWSKIVGKTTPAQYWIQVHDYFRQMQWGEQRLYLRRDLDVAVAAAPMEYLHFYAHACFYNEYSPRGIPGWASHPHVFDGRGHNLYCAMLLSVETQMRSLDYRASIAWSMSASSKDAFMLFERMCTTSEHVEAITLPAL